MRTILSLLGITIGIFCIIAIKSSVDSLEKNILDGFKELGSDVIYISAMPWNEDPGKNYWKYAKRPDPSYQDFEKIRQNSKIAGKVAYTVFTGGRTIKSGSSSVSDAYIMGTTEEYQDIFEVDIEYGRYFTPSEFYYGSNKVILGASVAEALFQSLDPVGKKVKLFGQNYQVIGVIKKEGDSVFNILNRDLVIWISYNNVRKFVNTSERSTVGKILNVKAKEGYDSKMLKGDLINVLRSSRKLRPLEKNNFALNEMSTLVTIVDNVIGVMNIAGYIIGIFSLIIGMVSVANIMFVSVKERTSLIGIKKAIGAKHYMILLEFLVESIILCILGGIIGICIVWAVLYAVSSYTSFTLSLSFSNVFLGVILAVIVGILSGMIPAWLASKMDPVNAMRS